MHAEAESLKSSRDALLQVRDAMQHDNQVSEDQAEKSSESPHSKAVSQLSRPPDHQEADQQAGEKAGGEADEKADEDVAQSLRETQAMIIYDKQSKM